MTVACVWEHNGEDTILYVATCPGAYTRGPSLKSAAEKMEEEVRSWLRWAGEEAPEELTVEIVQEKESGLNIRDADSDVLFDTEREPLTREEYARLKRLALKSAEDFLALYGSIPDKDAGCAPPRETFYGKVPRTAREMYEHTKSVNAYYFAEIDVEADNGGDILACRRRGFARLEERAGFLDNTVVEGSYGEEWSLRKVLRRFIWHDRIHAKAMWRLAEGLLGDGKAADPFGWGKN